MHADEQYRDLEDTKTQYILVSAPCDIFEPSSLKERLQVKRRVFSIESEYNQFMVDIMREKRIGEKVVSLNDEEKDKLVSFGWEFKKYSFLDYPCKCGYCYKCREIAREELYEQMTPLDKLSMVSIYELHQEISKLTAGLSEKGRRYYGANYLPQPPCA